MHICWSQRSRLIDERQTKERVSASAESWLIATLTGNDWERTRSTRMDMIRSLRILDVHDMSTGENPIACTFAKRPPCQTWSKALWMWSKTRWVSPWFLCEVPQECEPRADWSPDERWSRNPYCWSLIRPSCLRNEGIRSEMTASNTFEIAAMSEIGRRLFGPARSLHLGAEEIMVFPRRRKGADFEEKTRSCIKMGWLRDIHFKDGLQHNVHWQIFPLQMRGRKK